MSAWDATVMTMRGRGLDQIAAQYATAYAAGR
jgi:hypothetical protein